MREKKIKKRGPKRSLRMTKKECCLAWAIALGLTVSSVAKTYAATTLYGTAEETDGTTYYVLTVNDGDNYTDTNFYASSKGSYGKVTINGGSVTGGGIFGGYINGTSSSSGSVHDNTVTVTGGILNETEIFGGYSLGTDLITNNGVIISGGTINNTNGIAGGYATTGTAENNYVKIGSDDDTDTNTEITIEAKIYGGYSAGSGNATKNSVTISDDITLSYSIYGGYSSSGDATANTVSITGATVNCDVYGNYAGSGKATGATVTETDEDGNETTVADTSVYSVTLSGVTLTVTQGIGIYGGYGMSGADYNSVKIENSSVNTVFGGYSASGTDDDSTATANGNIVTVSNSTITFYVIGGMGAYESSDNKVNVTDSTVGYAVYGGSYGSEIADNNYVYIYDSEVKGTEGVLGGQGSIEANYNEVEITENSIISYNVYGGYSYSEASSGGNADYNNVSISSSTTVGGGVSGGFAWSSYYTGSATGNTVQLTSASIGTQNFYEIITSTYAMTFSAVGGLGLGGATSNEVTVSGGTLASNVLGGVTLQAAASENKVTVKDNVEISGSVYGGATYVLGDTSKNEVTITGSTVLASVYGGYSTYGDYATTIATMFGLDTSGNATENTVAITGSSITGSVYGGLSVSGTAVGNSITVDSITDDDGAEISSTIGGSVYGGYAKSDTAAGNSVKVTSGTIGDSADGADDNVYGNYSETGNALGYYTDDSGSTVAVTSVTMTGGTVENTVYGGKGASADSNSVVISGTAQVGLYVVGGEATDDEGLSTGNTVTLSGEAIIGIYSKDYTTDSGAYLADDADVIGGWATGSASSATSNSVTISDSVKIYGNATGGYGTGTVSENSVTMSGGTITGNAYGGYSDSSSGVVTGNKVELSGTATVQNLAIGGYNESSAGAEVSENSVTIKDSAYAAFVYGGHSYGDVTENTVTISGDETSTNAAWVIGGWSFSSDAVKNTVSIENAVIEMEQYTNAAYIYGGLSSSGDATANDVSINSSAVYGTVYGGYGASASGNTVTLSSVTTTGSVYGNYAYNGSAAGDYTYTDSDTSESVTVATAATTIENSTIGTSDQTDDVYVYGNYSYSGSATGSSGEIDVTITSSTVYGSVYGGYSYNLSGAAEGNSVSLTGTSDAKTTITGSVYGGYGSTSTGNSVSIYGYVSVTGAIYGGNNASGANAESTSSYNTLWVASTENYAETLYNFDTITFDIAGLSNDNRMLTLSATATDLTGVSSIGLYEDSSSIASSLGEILYLIDTEGTISVTAASLQVLDGTVEYILSSESGTSGLTVDNASLKGYYTRELQVISYDEDNNIVEEAADDSGVITGEDLVLRVGDTVYVEAADFDLAEDSAEYAWGAHRITLDEAKYEFSSDTTIADIGSLTVTGISRTLIADGEASVLLDGSSAESVTDISEVSLESLSSISITYTPADSVTVTGTTYVDTDKLNNESTEADSLSLVSSSIDSITFGSISYIAPDEGALIVLDGTSTYDMSGTEIDVSGLTLLDSDSNNLEVTVNDEDVEEIVMTLIASNGSVTNLGHNTDVNNGASISGEQTFGYLLKGSTYDSDEGTGASLEGTLTGYVISEDSSESTSEISVLSIASASEDDTDKETDTYDLVLRTGTDVAVTSATFLTASETDDGAATVELSDESTALITLNSALSYDFTEAELTDSAATVKVKGDAIESTMLANDAVIVELLAVNGADVTSLSTLSEQVSTAYSEYTYTPVSGVTVTGNIETVTDEYGVSMAVDTIGTVSFGSITYISPDDGALITLDGTSTYDMSETEIDVSGLTIEDDGSGAINESYDGDEIVMTLIDASGSVTNLEENEIAEEAEVSQTFGYELIGTDSDGNETGATLGGTLTGYVTVEADASGNDSSYDLLIRTGTTVSVTDAVLNISSLNVEGDAQLTLSALTYDFSELVSDGISITGANGETNIENASTLIDSITLIDGSNATEVIGMGVLAGYGSAYSYSIGDSIDVTGEGETAISSDGRTLSYDILNILTLDFWIDENTSTDKPMLTVETADLSGTDITAHAQDGDYLEPGYEIVLIEATEEDGLTTDDETTYTGKIYDGVSIEYELEVTKEDDTIVARITEDESEENDASDTGDASGNNKSSSAALRDETKSLAVTRLAQTAMIDQGTDLLVFAFDEAFMTVRERTKWTPYIAMSAGDFDYGTQDGSLDIESFHATIGLLRNTFDDDGVFSWGPVFQYGKADYDSYTNGVTASGETEYVGGGLFARRRWDNGTYIEGAVTGGYSDADYGSVTILEGTTAAFSVGSEYWAAYAGLARDYRNGHGRTFKPYIRYNYSHLEDAQARLSSGELYSFGSVDSSRLSAGFRIIWDMDEQISGMKDRYHTYLGAAYSYQFDGSAVGVYKGLSTLSPTLRGGSCMVEGGLRYRPNDGNMSIDLGVNGWFGNQEGIGGVLKFKWDL